MSKDANSFLLDSSILDHPKVLELRAEGGMEYFGILVAIYCKLRDATDYQISTKYLGGLALSFGITKEKLIQIIDLLFELELLSNDENFFWSKGLNDKLENYDDLRGKKSLAGKKGADARWNKENKEDNSILIAESCDAIAMPLANDGLYKSNITKSNLIKSNIIKSNLNKIESILENRSEPWKSPEATHAIEEWIEHRKQLKKPLTEIQLSKLLENYQERIPEFIKSVDHTIEKGWQGLRAPDENFRTNAPNYRETQLDRNFRILGLDTKPQAVRTSESLVIGQSDTKLIGGSNG